MLPTVSVPTLVVHRAGDRAAPVEGGRYLAEHIPGAGWVELPGDDHFPWIGDSESILAAVQEFVTGERREPATRSSAWADARSTRPATASSPPSTGRRAIRCACALRDAVRALGLSLRAGLHTGECQLAGDKVSGLAVHVGARVAARAGTGEVWVSSTVRDLVAGSGIRFEDRGAHVLKGVPGERRLYSVDP